MSRPPIELMPAMTGGVSQQSEWQRLPTQVKRQENAWCSIDAGVGLRHPFQHVGGILFTDHGGPAHCHFINRSTTERRVLVMSYKEPRVFDLDTGVSFPVIPKGGAGPTNFDYLIAKRPETFAITNAEALNSLSTSGGAKGGAAAGKTITLEAAPGSSIGPIGGTLRLAGFSADTSAGFWFSFTTAGTGGTTLAAGWNTISCYIKRGTNADRVGLGIYDDTAADFVAVVTYKWTGALQLDTPTYVAGSSTNPNIRPSVEDIGFGWFRLTLKYKATVAGPGLGGIGNLFSFGLYFTNPAGFSEHIPAGLRYDRSFDAGDFWIPPREAYDLLTLNDYTLVLNRSKTTALTSAVSLTKIFGAILIIAQGVVPTSTSFWTITGPSGSKNIEFRNAAVADADPTYYVDTATGAPTTAQIASRVADAVNRAFGQGIAHSCGNAISVIFKAGFAVLVTETNDGAGALTSFSLNFETHFNVRGASYDDPFWIRFRRNTLDIRIATVATASLGASGTASSGVDKCVNGEAAAVTTAAACAQSNGQQGVRVRAGAVATTERAVGISPDDIVSKLHAHAVSALTAISDIETDGYVLKGSGGTAAIPTHIIMMDRDHGTLRLWGTADFDAVSSFDAVDGQSLLLMRGEVKGIEDLPRYSTQDLRVRVNSDDSTDLEDSIFRAVTESGLGFGKVDWEESMDYNVHTTFDKTTMPHQLVRRQDDGAGTVTGTAFQIYYEWDYVNWNTRVVGDESIAPQPSFVGKALRGMTWWRSRFVVFTADGFTATAVNPTPTEGFNFWRTSVRERFDDDPIDPVNNAQSNVSHIRPSNLHSAIPFADRLYLISDSTIFVVTGEPTLTMDSVAIRALQEVSTDPLVRPIATQRSLLIPFRRGAYMGMSEMLLSEEAQTQRPLDLTQAVKTYFSGAAYQVTISTEEEIAAIAHGTTNHIAIFKWQDSGSERVQAAWHGYSIGNSQTTLRGIGFINSDLFAVVQRPHGWLLQKMALGNGLYEADGSYLASLDFRLSEDSPGFLKAFAAGTTTITIPYGTETGETYAIVNRSTGSQITTVNPASGSLTLTVSGSDLTATNLWVGIVPTMEVSLYPPMVRLQSGAGEVGRRLQTTELKLAYEQSAGFEVRVTTKTGGLKQYFFTAPSKDSSVNGTVVPYRDTGRFTVPVSGNASENEIVIRNASYTPCRFSKVDTENYKVDAA